MVTRQLPRSHVVNIPIKALLELGQAGIQHCGNYTLLLILPLMLGIMLSMMVSTVLKVALCLSIVDALNAKHAKRDYICSKGD